MTADMAADVAAANFQRDLRLIYAVHLCGNGLRFQRSFMIMAARPSMPYGQTLLQGIIATYSPETMDDAKALSTGLVCQ